jgi:O-antigen/teichoic acid export membrane protein/CelD/BcsL family acetyltransferase involved in cellulose biosynthesis
MAELSIADDGELRSTGRQGLSIITVRIGGAALALVAQVFASRMVGADDFGRYSLLLVWLLLFGHSASLGMGRLVYRYLAQYLKANDGPRATGLLRYALAVVIGLSAVVSALTIAALHLDLFGFDARTIMLGTLAFLAIPLLGLQDYLEAIARGLDRPNLGIAPAFLLRHMAVIAGLTVMAFAGVAADALWVMLFTILGFLASIIVQYALLHRYVRTITAGQRPVYATRAWTLAALPMCLGEFSGVLFNNADVMILGLFAPPDQVGFYFAATRLAQMLTYVPYGISAVTSQKYAALAEPHERPQLQSLISSAALSSTLLTVAATVVLAVLARPLLSLFSPEFVAADYLVPLLCLSTVATCLLGPGNDVLNMLGQERRAAAAFVMALVVNVGLNFLLIPLWGPVGAVVAGVAALSLRGVVMAWYSWRHLGLIVPAGLSFLVTRNDTAKTASTVRRAGAATDVTLTHRDEAGIAGIDPAQWDRLSAHSIEDNPFYSRQYVMAGLETIDANKGLRALTFHDAAGTLIGFVPYRRRFALPLAWSAAHLYQHCGTPLFDRDRAADAVAAWLDAMASGKAPRVWVMGHVPQESRLSAMIAELAAERGMEVRATGLYPRAFLTRATGSFEKHVQAVYSKNRLRSIQKSLRQLEATGTLTLETAVAPDAVRARLEDFLTLESSGWKGRSGTALAASEADARFARLAFGGTSGREGLAQVSTLLLDGRPIASNVSIRAGAIAFLPKIAYDESLRSLGPGMVSAHLMIKEFFEASLPEAVDSAATNPNSNLLGLWNSQRLYGTSIVGPAGWPTRLVVKGLTGYQRLKQWAKKRLGRA